MGEGRGFKGEVRADLPGKVTLEHSLGAGEGVSGAHGRCLGPGAKASRL